VILLDVDASTVLVVSDLRMETAQNAISITVIIVNKMWLNAVNVFIPFYCETLLALPKNAFHVLLAVWVVKRAIFQIARNASMVIILVKIKRISIVATSALIIVRNVMQKAPALYAYQDFHWLKVQLSAFYNAVPVVPLAGQASLINARHAILMLLFGQVL
jgi:hypothetical protein